jgi:hypothetical protein
MTAAWTAAATIGGALISAEAAKGAGAQQSGTATTTTGPMAELKGAYAGLAGDFEDVQSRGLLGQVQRYSDYERDLINEGMLKAASGNPFMGLQERAATTLLEGQLPQEAANIYRDVGQSGFGLSNPEFLAASQRAVQQAMRPVTSTFAQGGRLGSGLYADTLAEASGNAFAPMLLQAQQQGMANKLQAASGLSGVAGQQASQLSQGVDLSNIVDAGAYTDIGRGMQFGNLLPSEQYRIDQSDVTALERGSDIARNLNVGSEQTQPLYSNSGNDSAALLGAGIAQAGQNYFNYKTA